jgi:hypothetical protein
MSFVDKAFSSNVESMIKSDIIDNYELPKTYNDTKIVILPQNPTWIYAYWEVSHHVIKEMSKQYNEVFNSALVVLRVYDVTDTNFNNSNAHKYFDIKVNPESLSWYINVGEYNRSWRIDIGYVLKNGKYIAIASSNTLVMPRYGLFNFSDEQWSLLKLEFEKLFKILDSGEIVRSSFGIARTMKTYFEEILKLPSSNGFDTLRMSFKSGQPLKKFNC